jgi:23S rRNA pseudouridine2457 synthase
MTSAAHTRYHYIIFNKPYGVLCQFSKSEGKETLANYGPFPKDVYPAGRLDADSEGLVLLTDDGRLKHMLLEPRFRHPRTYCAQVEHIPTAELLDQLRAGVLIEGKETLPAQVERLDHDPEFPLRTVPVRFRKNVPTAWLRITIYEGRNRQVRKMTAAIGHPTLRLVRIRIASISLGALKPGEHRALSTKEIGELRRTVGGELTG